MKDTSARRSFVHRRSLDLMSPWLSAAALAFTVSATSRADAESYCFTPIASLGDPASDEDTFVNDFEPTALNNHGDLAFTADLLPQGATESPGEGVFLSSKGRISQILRVGQPAPRLGVFGPAELGHLGLNDAGDMAIPFSLFFSEEEPLKVFLLDNGGFSFYGGVYRYSHITRALSPVVVPDVTPAPGGGTFFGIGFNVSLNNRKHIAFSASVSDAPASSLEVFVADERDRIMRVVPTGELAPSGGRFLVQSDPELNNRGDVVFAGVLSTNPPDSPDSSNVFVRRAATGEIVAVTRTGESLPGDATFVSELGHHINARGSVAFGALVEVASSESPVGALYLSSPRGIVRVAGWGDEMDGGGQLSALGTEALRGGSQLSLNDRDQVAFNATLDDGKQGLYLYSNGYPNLVAKTGTEIQGVGTIDYFQSEAAPLSFMALNERGQLAFAATLTDGSGVLLLATPQPNGCRHKR
jgi:hypothetical protein